MAELKKYVIENVGGDDETVCDFEFTEEQYEFLKRVFSELNEHSEYCCMPTIHIERKESSHKRTVLDKDEIDFDYGAED